MNQIVYTVLHVFGSNFLFQSRKSLAMDSTKSSKSIDSEVGEVRSSVCLKSRHSISQIKEIVGIAELLFVFIIEYQEARELVFTYHEVDVLKVDTCSLCQ